MDLLAQLRSAREQTAGTLAVLDALVERVSRLQAALSPEGSGRASNGVAGPGIHRAPTLPPTASTRDRVLALTGDWISSPDIQAGMPDIARTTVHSMIGNLLREGMLKRRGTRNLYQFLRAGELGATEPPKRRHGTTRAQILALVSDWTPSSEVRARALDLGLTQGQINAAIRNMIEDEQLRVRGEPRAREYKAKG